MIPRWWPDHPAIYDIHQSYQDNLTKGPFFKGEIPFLKRPEKNQWINFCGYKIASPVGVAAGPLLNSKWVELASQLGYDIVTYKTIRSQKHPCHPLPNCSFVDIDQPLDPQNIPRSTSLRAHPPKSMKKLSITNSFGMPSQSCEYLKEDIPKARAILQPGQVLVVSISGNPTQEVSLMQDFVKAALMAKEYGAEIIEANFSCPNVTSLEGTLYLDPEAAFAIAKALVTALKGTPLIIKVGVFKDLNLMRRFFKKMAQAQVRAISGINTVSMEVLDANNKPALGPQRLRSGICGAAIFDIAQDFIKSAYQINLEEKLGLTLIGVGGVTQAGDFTTLLECGAHAVQTASGMMWDPYLAMRFHAK